ncbi:MAG TPA: cytidine deaminase [Actinospica sp.]|nr:cytidine deaminase [Actinospica sp.]
MDAELDPEDAKIITLARSARARGESSTGAAVRDSTGRTYAAVDVPLESVPLSALRLAVAMAYSSGGTRLEAAAVVVEAGKDEVLERELAAAWELAAAHVLLAGPDGALIRIYPNPDASASA